MSSVPPPLRAAEREQLATEEVELGEWVQQVKEAIFYARVCARSQGYALAVHGTLRRDIDVVAVPWTEEACDADELFAALCKGLVVYGMSYENVQEAAAPTREVKPHGRLAWSIPLKWKFHTGAAPYLDLSVTPRAAGYAKPSLPPDGVPIACSNCDTPERLEAAHLYGYRYCPSCGRKLVTRPPERRPNGEPK